jgi:hypothetical protein
MTSRGIIEAIRVPLFLVTAMWVIVFLMMVVFEGLKRAF